MVHKILTQLRAGLRQSPAEVRRYIGSAHNSTRLGTRQAIGTGMQRGIVLFTAIVLLVSATACGQRSGAQIQGPSGKPQAASQNEQATPTSKAASKVDRKLEKPDWETFLLLGLDQRGKETPRSDTMIIVNWDKANNIVNVLSVPRDLWVNIPGYGYYKLGSAYTLGSGSDGPGGPQLAQKTLELNLGIDIDHYAAVSLQSFRKIVNRLGGVWVDVPTPLVDNAYPTDNYKYQRIYIPTGLQHMDGAEALEYARSRHESSDFGRSQRQEQVLMAIREQVTSKSSVTKIPSLIKELHGDVKTDLSVPNIIKLAPAATDIHTNDIHSNTLDYNYLVPAQSSNGQSILLPPNNNWQKLRSQIKSMLENED